MHRCATVCGSSGICIDCIFELNLLLVAVIQNVVALACGEDDRDPILVYIAIWHIACQWLGRS